MASIVEKRREKFGQLLFEVVGRGNVTEIEELLKNKKYDLDYSRRVEPKGEIHEEKNHRELEEEIGYYLEENALEYATRKGNIEMMKYLKEKGLSFNRRNLQLLEHTTYEKDAEVLRFLFNNQMIGSRDAANRAMSIVFRKIERGGEIPPNDNIIYQLIKSPSFSLKDVDNVEFLKAAFMAGVADEVLKRGDLNLDEDGKEELLQVAMEHGSPNEIQTLMARSDIKVEEVNYTNVQVPLYGDHASLLDLLMTKSINDPIYNEAILDLLENESISLERNGLYLLTRALDLGDSRIIDMLASRADVFTSVIRFGDDDIAQMLLDRDDLQLDPDVLIVAAQNKNISPDTIHDILSHDNFDANEDVFAKSANLAGKAGRFDAVHEIVEHYYSENDHFETLSSGELLNTCVNAAVKEYNSVILETNKTNQKAEQTLNQENEVNASQEVEGLESATIIEEADRKIEVLERMKSVVRDLYERDDYDPNSDIYFESTVEGTSVDKEIFLYMAHRQGLSMGKYGYTFLKNAFERGYEDVIDELLGREDIRVGERVDELIGIISDRFKGADNIRQRLTQIREREHKELEERQYAAPGHEMSM